MSSSPYNADQGAVPSDFDYTRLLSQRDLSSSIPINFVTVPGVSLTSACFPFNRYDTASATKCVSNLLAAGFRRLEVDLFWDVSRTTWSFCPVQLGEVEPQLSVKQESTTSQTPLTSATLAQDEIDGRRKVRATPSADGGQEPNGARLWPRQTTTDDPSVLTQSSRPTMSASSIPSGTTTRTAALSPEISSTVVSDAANPESTAAPDDQTLLRVGDYVCSTQLDFHLFLQVLYGHFANTEDNLNATTAYITLNIYPAASASSAEGSDATPSQENLPHGNNLLSSLITANNSQYLYTPQLLNNQRADLDEAGSWFTVRQPLLPDYMFYEVNRDNNILSTPDGWPSESVVELARAKRMLAGFGNIDSRMQGYDFSLDESTIFPPGYLQDSLSVEFATNGTIASGCIFNVDDASLSQANSSWATHHISNDSSAADQTTLRTRLAQASNLTDCGISPILNTTLLNASADTNPTPYKSYAMSTIWSWAPDQPQNFGTSDDDDNDDDDQTNGPTNRCAVLNATSTRWQAHSCATSHHVTCRANNANPFDFRIADASAAYDKAENACRGDVQFAVPRTALENSFLAAKWRAYRAERGVEDELLWVDFNDLDIAGCWVIGQNSTCPYQDQQLGQGREIVVPTVAAVVVFVLAILTVFIKCASNRRNTRRRRKRFDDGWDYEGVPS